MNGSAFGTSGLWKVMSVSAFCTADHWKSLIAVPRGRGAVGCSENAVGVHWLCWGYAGAMLGIPLKNRYQINFPKKIIEALGRLILWTDEIRSKILNKNTPSKNEVNELINRI